MIVVTAVVEVAEEELIVVVVVVVATIHKAAELLSVSKKARIKSEPLPGYLRFDRTLKAPRIHPL